MVIHKNEHINEKACIEPEKYTLKQCFELLFPTFDGSMTQLLEICFDTQIHVFLLEQTFVELPHDLAQPLAGWHAGAPALKRRVLLQHGKTKQNLLFATSFLILSNAPPILYQSMQEQILLPLGKTLRTLPLMREIVQTSKAPAEAEWRTYFDLPEDAHCLSRRSFLHFEQGAAMLLEEVIPCSK